MKLKKIDCLTNKFFQSNMGAKNHGVVLHDANVDATLNALVAAGFGAAGQRCMALSTVVFVGDSKSWYSPLFMIFSLTMHKIYFLESQKGQYITRKKTSF